MKDYRAEFRKVETSARRLTRMPKPTKVAQAVRLYQPDCLPHQVELLRDTKTKILGLCSGFGGGKSWVAARKVIQLLTLNPGYDGIVTEPTIPLLVKIMYPELEKAFDEAGFRWKFNKQDKIYNVLVKGKWTRVLCESMENYTRLIGINAAWIVADEFDTTKQDIAMAAYHKLLGRLRAGNVRQFVIVSTPEGFRAMYQIFEVEKDSQKRLIRARTTDNIHLPADFIDTLRSQYPENLINAYLDGKFVNLTSGAVYKSFDRELNGTSKETVQPDDQLIIGMDFNVTKMAAVVYVRRQRVELVEIEDEETGQIQAAKLAHDEIHAVDEFVDLFDTPDMIAEIEARYPDHCANQAVWVYPDASGKSRKTVNASASDIALLEDAGFYVEYDSTNPPVKDRLIAMNTMMRNALGQRHYFVNLAKCPTLAKCLEQQVFNDKGEPDKSAGVDHMNDAAGYPIAHLVPVIRPVATMPSVSFY